MRDVLAESTILETMGPGLLAAIIVVGSLVFAGVLCFVIISAVRGAVRRANAQVVSEGIVLDSGSVYVTFRLRRFRAPGIYVGVGTRAGYGRLVLTRRRLCMVPVPWGLKSVADVALHDLAQFQVGIGEGGLLLRTNDPPNGRGSADIFVSVPSADTWVKALTDAGARPLAA